MVSITEFLRARIAEDENENKDQVNLEWDDAKGWAVAYSERVLAECTSKRLVIALHEAFGRSGDPEARPMWHATRAALEIMAGVYSDHPDYNQKWGPNE